MMAVVAGTSFVLGVAKPKTKAVITEHVSLGEPTVGANDMAILIGFNLPVSNLQEIVGAFTQLRNHALSYLNTLSGGAGVLEVSLAPGDAPVNIVTTGHTDNLLTLYIDAAVYTESKSHFIDRTFKRLIELLLERAK